MKELVDRYVRSLKERDDHPEHRSDLGTLVCWILERRGFRVLERAFKHQEHERRVSKGRAQFGIDILAVREEGDEIHSYRLVIKRGDIRKWTPGEEGSLPADLWLAASDKEREKRYGVTPTRVTVIAVHNGDRDSEGRGHVIESYLDNLRTKTDVHTDWWDAAGLTDLIMTSPGVSTGPDASLFPPAIQPFIRMALDSLLPERGTDGSGFDLGAVDLVIERHLAARATSTSAPPISGAEELHRHIAETSLLVSMIQAECARVAGGVTLPVLDTLDRVLCGAVDAIGQITTSGGPCPRMLQDDLEVLLSLYTDTAERLRVRLEPMLGITDGLAAPLSGEPVNLPLRVLRLCGYMAVGGMAALAAGKAAVARNLATALKDIWANNEAGCLQPVTDDQLIEIVLTWDLWARLGMSDGIRDTARHLVQRLAVRKILGLPLPALWQRARVPMRGEDVAVLVEACLSGRNRSSAFADGGSTILPAAVYAARKLGATIEPNEIAAFVGDREHPPVFAQVWVPPDDAGDRWYREGIEHDGTTHVLPIDRDDDEFERAFENVGGNVADSLATRLGLPTIDRIAWKLMRTPPPMSILLELLREAPPGGSEPTTVEPVPG